MSKKLCFVLLLSLFAVRVVEAQTQKHLIEFSLGEPFSHCAGINLITQPSLSEIETTNKWSSAGLLDGYHVQNWCTTPISFAYYYQALLWLQVGAESSTFSHSTSYFTFSGNVSTAKWLTTDLYLTGGVRFNYFHKNIVDLYSGLSLGVGVRMFSTETESIAMVNPHFVWQVTALGVRFGKQVYGIAEIGYGYKGFVNLGIGVRF